MGQFNNQERGKFINLPGGRKEMKRENIKLSVWTCVRCGHEWASRQKERPKRCARCTACLWWIPAGSAGRGRKMIYPVKDMKQGEEMLFDFDAVRNYVSMRQSIIAYGQRHGMRFEFINKINSFIVKRIA